MPQKRKKEKDKKKKKVRKNLCGQICQMGYPNPSHLSCDNRSVRPVESG